MFSTLEEHFGYLSDPRRTELFQQALSIAIRPGDLVADIGCGFGILGLLGLRAGAGHVWGIDRTDAIEVARETMARAGFGDRYTCIRDHSFRAVLPQPVDAIVCDHVGYFGLDYGIVETMQDARRRFLQPGGKVVPGLIRLVLAGVSSQACRHKAENWTGGDIPREYHWLREYSVNTKHGYNFRPDELSTAPVLLGSIDLTVDNPPQFKFTASLRASRDMTLDGLAGWFECELAGGVCMTNSPLAEGRIDRPQVFLALDEPIALRAGDAIEVAVTMRHEERIITWRVGYAGGKTQTLSTWRSMILDEADLKRNPDRVPLPGAMARARQVVLGYVDGVRTAGEIQEAVLRDHPQLLPSPAETLRFVLDELARVIK